LPREGGDKWTIKILFFFLDRRPGLNMEFGLEGRHPRRRRPWWRAKDQIRVMTRKKTATRADRDDNHDLLCGMERADRRYGMK